MPESPVADRVRAVERYKQGKTMVEIAEELGRSEGWVRYWLRREESGKPLENLVRPGRPKKLSPEQEEAVVDMLRDRSVGSLRRVRKRLQMDGTASVSVGTIRNTAKRRRLRCVRERRKPKLTDTQKEKRLAFASTSRPPNYWNRVLFTDECIFPVFGPALDRWIGPEEEVPTKETVKNSPYVMVWAGVGSKGKTRLYKLEQGVRLNAAGYQELLSKALPSIQGMWPKRDRWILMQDGAPCHRAKATMEWLTSKEVRVLQPWPAQSPDLNIIENVWHMLKQRVYREEFKTTEELWAALQREWKKIKTTEVQNLIDSMPRRLKSVIEAKGGHTKY